LKKKTNPTRSDGGLLFRRGKGSSRGRYFSQEKEKKEPSKRKQGSLFHSKMGRDGEKSLHNNKLFLEEEKGKKNNDPRKKGTAAN